MANAKWSGIEQWKYGLTARWYVSAKYGYATDEGGWGLYDPVSNVDGWGGKKRPFDGLDTLQNNISSNKNTVVLFDTGKYRIEGDFIPEITFIGENGVVLDNVNFAAECRYKNLSLINCRVKGNVNKDTSQEDVFVFGGHAGFGNGGTLKNCIYVDCSFNPVYSPTLSNCVFIRCSGNLNNLNTSCFNNMYISPENMMLTLPTTRPSGIFNDYSIIIGVFSNGKTLEDFKAEGQYFRKSYSEVDLFGNESGSGASVTQLNTIFNNFYYPYIDDWQYLDLSLRPDVDDRVRYGGLNGHFIGTLPVGYHFDIPTLWNTYKDAGNTTNVELNAFNRLIRTNPSIPGVYTSTTITLPSAINETDVAMFFKNNVYDSNGVAVQRLDYSADPDKDAALEQRTVYSYRMKTSPDDVTPLTDWKEYELDRAPTIDDLDRSNLDPNFDVSTQKKQPIKRFIIEITLRSE